MVGLANRFPSPRHSFCLKSARLCPSHSGAEVKGKSQFLGSSLFGLCEKRRSFFDELMCSRLLSCGADLVAVLGFPVFHIATKFPVSSLTALAQARKPTSKRKKGKRTIKEANNKENNTCHIHICKEPSRTRTELNGLLSADSWCPFRCQDEELREQLPGPEGCLGKCCLKGCWGQIKRKAPACFSFFVWGRCPLFGHTHTHTHPHTHTHSPTHTHTHTLVRKNPFSIQRDFSHGETQVSRRRFWAEVALPPRVLSLGVHMY